MTTIRNPKNIQSKSRTHTVAQIGNGHFLVTSGASGSTYAVELMAGGGAHCTCEWAKYRPSGNGGKSGCSHVVAVYNHLAETQGRTASAWVSPDEAKRQHRPALNIGDGVILTTRKAG